jgi:hypothetical protein
MGIQGEEAVGREPERLPRGVTEDRDVEGSAFLAAHGYLDALMV